MAHIAHARIYFLMFKAKWGKLKPNWWDFRENLLMGFWEKFIPWFEKKKKKEWREIYLSYDPGSCSVKMCCLGFAHYLRIMSGGHQGQPAKIRPMEQRNGRKYGWPVMVLFSCINIVEFLSGLHQSWWPLVSDLSFPILSWS